MFTLMAVGRYKDSLFVSFYAINWEWVLGFHFMYWWKPFVERGPSNFMLRFGPLFVRRWR
jgi:hypothetical protein